MNELYVAISYFKQLIDNSKLQIFKKYQLMKEVRILFLRSMYTKKTRKFTGCY